jgi:hypothetical protein
VPSRSPTSLMTCPTASKSSPFRAFQTVVQSRSALSLVLKACTRLLLLTRTSRGRRRRWQPAGQERAYKSDLFAADEPRRRLIFYTHAVIMRGVIPPGVPPQRDCRRFADRTQRQAAHTPPCPARMPASCSDVSRYTYQTLRASRRLGVSTPFGRQTRTLSHKRKERDLGQGCD